MDSSLTEVPLISVVVPVYKVEKYLKKCVDSIIAQTYKNIEIILVDDGSPDSCPAICDEYAEKDSRVKVVHRQNGGLSAARNSGIKIASGKYISFIDSDDFIQPVYIEQLYLTAEASGSSLSVASYSHEEDKLDAQLKTEFKVYSDEEALKEILIERDFFTSACDKLYLTKMFDSIKFPEGEIYEDYAVMPMLFNEAKKISYVNSKLYFYRKNSESITKSVFNEKHMQYFKTAEKVNEYIKNNYPEQLNHAINRDTNMAIAFYRKISQSDYNNSDITTDLIKRIRNGLRLYMNSTYPLIKKLTAIAISVSPSAAKLFLKYKK